MPWVVFEKPTTVRLHDDAYMPDDYWVEVNDNGTAQVPADVAVQLVESDLDVTYKED
jgi:hypothetical protein